MTSQVSSTTPAVVADDHVFLIGRPPMSEYFAFLEGETVQGQLINRGQAADLWRSANDHVKQLELREAGLADAATVEALPAEMMTVADRIVGNPVTQRAFAIVPVTVGMVELDRLVVFQKRVNVSYVRALQHALPDVPTSHELLEFCLPLDRRYDPPVEVKRVGPSQWMLTSQSHDFRHLGFVQLDPGMVPLNAVDGVPSVVVASAIGYGSNFFTALDIDERLILFNGSHRAFALRDKGIKHAPCLIQHATRVEELEMIGAAEVFARRDLYLESPRPPLLKDYFDEKLRITVQVPRRSRQVLVGINVQTVDV